MITKPYEDDVDLTCPNAQDHDLDAKEGLDT